MTARHGTAQHVENLVRHFRHALDAEESGREARQQKNRSVAWRYDDDGSLILKARLPAEIGAMVLKALDAAMEQMPVQADDPAAEVVDVSAETPTVKLPRTARRADALGAMAESFVQHGLEAMSGGDKHQVLDDGALRFLKSNGESLDSIAPGHSQPLGDWRRLPAHHKRDLIRIDANTAVTKWQGESIDYGLGVEVLLQRARRSRVEKIGC